MRYPMAELRTVEWTHGRVRMIDQTELPKKLVHVIYRNHKQVAKAIKEMVVRGAPAIGVAAAMGLALAANSSRSGTKEGLLSELEAAAKALEESRPTAWNLFWATNRILQVARRAQGEPKEIASRVTEEALRMAEEDVEANHRIGEYGATLLDDGDRVLTHCNTGTLATVNYGTALAPIRTAIKHGKKLQVIATETRPRLQGARLTTYELLSDKIPVTLIVDGAVGYLMKKGLANKVIVGADRVTTSYVANKIGTYVIALAAKANKVPFYVAAPSSTFDLRPGQHDFEIEERNCREVTHIDSRRIVPKGVSVFNPAFDLTPIELVDGFVTERGVVSAGSIAAGTLYPSRN